LRFIAEGILEHLDQEDQSWAGTKEEPKQPKPKKVKVKKVSEERERHIETLRRQVIEPREEAARKERRGPDDLRRELDEGAETEQFRVRLSTPMARDARAIPLTPRLTKLT
jgi:hypothetical protein